MVQLLTMCAKAFITYIRANVPVPNVCDWYISLASSALKHVTAASPVPPFCFFHPHLRDPQFPAYQNWTVSPQRSSCDSNSASISQDTPSILWDPKFYHCAHNNPQIVTIISQMNPVNVFPAYFLKFHFNIIFQSAPSSPKAVSLLQFLLCRLM